MFPSESGLSLLLALHVPLAALGAFALARHLGASRVLGASATASSTRSGASPSPRLNLYVYVQALAWAPLVVLAALPRGSGSRRDVGLAALVLGVA